MYNFTVSDMTCSHCAGTIEKAIKSIDPAAGIIIDLPNKSVQVETKQSTAEVAQAIKSAGYTGTLAA